jgi:hypothetical protein
MLPPRKSSAECCGERSSKGCGSGAMSDLCILKQATTNAAANGNRMRGAKTNMKPITRSSHIPCPAANKTPVDRELPRAATDDGASFPNGARVKSDNFAVGHMVMSSDRFTFCNHCTLFY